MELNILQRPTATCIRSDGSMLAVLLTDMHIDLYDKDALGQKAVQAGAKTRHCPGFTTAFDGEVTKNGLEASRPPQASGPTNRKESSKDSLPPKPLPPSQEPTRPASTGALPTRAAASASTSAGKATTSNNPATSAPANRAETGVNGPTPPPLKVLPAKIVEPLPPRAYTDEYRQLRVDNWEQRPPRDSKDPNDGRDPRTPREGREQREGRESREQPARDSRESHSPRDVHARDLRAPEAARADQARDLGTPGRRASDVAEPRAPNGSVQKHAWPVAERSERPDRDRPARPESLRRNDAEGAAERDSRQTREQTPGRAHETRPPRDTARESPREGDATPQPSLPTSQPPQESHINPERARLLDMDKPRDGPRSVREQGLDRPSGPPSPRRQEHANATLNGPWERDAIVTPTTTTPPETGTPKEPMAAGAKETAAGLGTRRPCRSLQTPIAPRLISPAI